ncbi:tetratricopeptide repeat protein [Sulfurihydrogenibium sp.]|uniref:tetratricopeptide repeat protein n=1 Tax=Sulfurihydrogenibium sp. TaxID=2053621 RepID=UPI003D115BDC
MKKLIFSLIALFISIQAKANVIKLPEVVFPIEIVSQVLEEKPILPAPKNLDFKPLYDNLDVKDYLPLQKPYSVHLPFLKIKKPTAYLGIPKSNALLSDSIDYFERKDFLFAQENLKKFVEKYKDNENLFYAYYLLGYIDFEFKKYEEAKNYLEKSCSLNPLKENCLSYAITLINLNEFEKAYQVLQTLQEDQDVAFYKAVAKAFLKEKTTPNVDCDNIDVESADYCRYFLKHVSFLNGQFKESLNYRYNGQDKNLKKVSLLIDGFNYYFLKSYDKAENTFKTFLQNYLSSDNLTNLAYLGLGLTNPDKTKEYAEILETRDNFLSYYLYLLVINKYASEKDWLNTFAYIQKVLNLIDRNKENLRFDLAVSLYNLGNYDYALNIFQDLAKEKKDEQSYLYCGFSAYSQKLYQKAQECLSNIKESKDQDIRKTALIYLAEVYYILNDNENYVNTVSLLKDIDENLAYDYLGWYFFKNQDYENAYKAFRDPYMKAVSAFNAGNTEKAKELIKNKNNRKFLFLSAYIDIKENNIQSAKEKLKKIANQSNDELSKKAYYLYAYLYFSEGNFQEAIKKFDEFRKKFPEDDIYNQKAFLRIADSYYNLGEHDVARSMYKEFIEKYKGKKESIDAAYSLVLLETKGESSEKDKVIEDFIAKYPNYPMVDTLKLQLASIYEEKGELEKAEKIYKELSQKNTQEGNYAKYKLAEIYYKSNQTDKAKNILSQLIDSPDKDIYFQTNLLLAKIYEEEGDKDKAIEIYQRISDNDDIKFKLSNLLIDVGRYDEALTYLNQLIEKYPDKAPEISFYIGKIKYKQNNFDEAISYLEAATKSQNYNIASESYFLLGEIYNSKKDLNKALNAYLNAIYVNPQLNNITANARLKASDILIKAEKRKEASCIITPLLDYNDENIKNIVKEKMKNLPKCLR